MISKQYIKDLGFNTLDEFFNYILESHINGNYTQTREFIKKLSNKQYNSFINFLHYNDLFNHDTTVLLRMRYEEA